MFGRHGTIDRHPNADRSHARTSDQPPSTLGGWARAIGWGSLAVAGCGVILLLVAPGELAGATVVVGQVGTPCEQVRDQAGCRLVDQAVTATVPTLISTPGQVPFARSPTP